MKRKHYGVIHGKGKVKVFAVCLVITIVLFTTIVGVLRTSASQDSIHVMEAKTEHERVLKNGKCLRFKVGVHALIAAAPQVFIFMPAKAGGSSLKQFVNIECLGQPGMRRNEANVGWTFLFRSDRGPPRAYASHLYTNRPFLDVVKRGSPDSVILYIYRNETSRLESAISFVVNLFCWEKNLVRRERKNTSLIDKFEINGSACYIDEDVLVRPGGVIASGSREGFQEIEFGNPLLLTCTLYKAIQDEQARVIFIDYRKIDALQQAIATHNCPGMYNKTRQLNEGKKPQWARRSIQVRSQGHLTELRQWIRARIHSIEMASILARQDACPRKTKEISEELSRCEDGVMQLSL